MTESTPTKTPMFAKSWLVICSLSSLAAVGLLAAGGTFMWQKNQTISQQNTAQIAQLQTKIDDLNQQIMQSRQVVKKQQANIDSFISTQASDNINWQLDEARYLIHLANFSVTFEHNVKIAIALLQTADARIAELDNPTLMDLRQALANNITALQGVPQADISNILLQLNALGDQIAKLPVISTPNAVQQEPQPKHHHHHQPGWKRGLEQSWQQLKQIIVVQYHDQPVGELITPQNRDYLDLHLQMLFAQAEWGCLHQQATLYDNSIQQAISWVKNYYVESAPQTQALLTGLNQLQQEKISPQMPDISNSLQLINAQISNLSTPANEEIKS